MDIIKIQYKPGTIVKDIETGEVLIIDHFDGNHVYFVNAFKTGKRSFDFVGFLGKVYVKDRTAQVLYGYKRSDRNSR